MTQLARCDECRHFVPCRVLDHDRFDADFGFEASVTAECEYGFCEWDEPNLVRCDNDESVRTGEECYEP